MEDLTKRKEDLTKKKGVLVQEYNYLMQEIKKAQNRSNEIVLETKSIDGKLELIVELSTEKKTEG